MSDVTQDMEIAGREVPVVKAHFIGRDGSEKATAVSEPNRSKDLFNGTGAIEPPIDPNELAALFDMSGSLRTNIDTYATNIDGYGHDFEPIVDLEDEDTREIIRQALLEEKLHAAMAEQGGDETEEAAKAVKLAETLRVKICKLADSERTGEGDTPEDELDLMNIDVEVTEAEVDTKLEELQRAMIWERRMLEQFFDFCVVETSFVMLRAITRQDKETLGNGYWEVLRNAAGKPVQFVYVPGYTVRLLPSDKEPITVPMPVPRTILRVENEPVNRRFRKYIQILSNEAVRTYFKDFGDPRCYSSKTGKEYRDLDDLEAHEPGVQAANELVHFQVHSTHSPYGVPRWFPELLAVMGNRHAEEINLAFFENKSIPPMAILVSGGRLGKDETENLKDYIKNEIRGKKNFHKILLIQAEPAATALTGQNSGTVKIEIKPLTQAIQDDGMFMKYQEQNSDRIGSVFRLPRLLRGDVRDFNRATADASLEFAEQQVFGPLRKDFDWWINRFIFPALNAHLHKFRSKGPDTTDMEVLGKLLESAAKSGYLSIRELREVAARIFGKKFATVEDESADIPLEMIRLGVLDDAGDDDVDDGEPLPEDEDDDTVEQAQKRRIRRRRARAALKLMSMQTYFAGLAREEAAKRFAEAHEAVNGG